MRTPSHCSATILTRIKTARNRMTSPDTRPKAAMNSAIAIDKYPRTEQYISQSVQADRKSRCVAKGAAHIDIKPAGSREHDAQLRQTTCTKQCVYASGNPQQNNCQWRMQLLGDQARCAENSDTDGTTDTHRQTEADA